MRTLNFMTYLRKGFLLGGLSTTTWITFYPVLTTYPPRVDNSGYSMVSILSQGLLNRWTSQLDLGSTTGGLERVVSVNNST